MDKFDKTAKFYDIFFVQIFYSLAHKQNIKTIKEFVTEGSKILDIGCGTGNFLNRMKKIGKQIKLTGIDQSEEMIKTAKKKFGDINFSLASGDNLPFENNLFDLVTIIDAFYYLKNKHGVFSECRRILKQGAHLFIYTPSIDDFITRLLMALIKHFPTEKESEHLNFAKLKNIAEKHGFDIAIKKTSYFPFTPLKYWSLVLVKK